MRERVERVGWKPFQQGEDGFCTRYQLVPFWSCSQMKVEKRVEMMKRNSPSLSSPFGLVGLLVGLGGQFQE